MQRLRAADEAHRSHAEAELVHRAARRRDDVRVIGEAEVIVGAEIDRFARALRRRDMDAPALRPGQEPLALCESRRVNLVEGGADVVEKGVGHSGSPVQVSRSIAAPRECSNRRAQSNESHKKALWRLHQPALRLRRAISRQRNPGAIRMNVFAAPQRIAPALTRYGSTAVALPLGRRGARRFSRNAGSLVRRHPEGIAPILDQRSWLRRARLFRPRHRQACLANVAQAA